MKRLDLQYLNFKQLATVSFVAVFYTGCIGGKMPEKEIKLPSWYLNAPLNNGLYLYGSGEGSTLEQSKSNALNAMAAGLVVSVASSTQINTKTTLSNNQESYSKDVSKNLKVEVQKIKFTNATLKNSEHLGGKFYTLMQTNRIDLFDQQKGEFDGKDQRIEMLYRRLEGKSKLEQIHILQNIYPDIKEAKAQAIVLHAINNDFEYGHYIKKYDSYIDRIDEIKSLVLISVVTKQGVGNFKDHLIDMLNRDKFKVTFENKKSDIEIELSVQPKYSMASGWHIAKVTTTVSVVTNGKIVSNKIINSVGRSSTSQEGALEDASKRFRESLEKETLDKIVFGK